MYANPKCCEARENTSCEWASEQCWKLFFLRNIKMWTDYFKKGSFTSVLTKSLFYPRYMLNKKKEINKIANYKTALRRLNKLTRSLLNYGWTLIWAKLWKFSVLRHNYMTAWVKDMVMAFHWFRHKILLMFNGKYFFTISQIAKRFKVKNRYILGVGSLTVTFYLLEIYYSNIHSNNFYH